MAGSSAALGIASGIANAEVVQIVLVNNQATTDGTNTLSADLTGDGVDDLMNVRALSGIGSIEVFDTYSFTPSIPATRRLGYAGFSATSTIYRVLIGSLFSSFLSDQAGSPRNLASLMNVTFMDARINGGQETQGFVEILARNSSQTSHQVALTRLIFDNASTSRPSASAAGSFPDANLPAIVTVDPNAALSASLLKKLKREQRKLRRARQAGNSTKVQKIQKKIRRFRKQLRTL